MTDSTATRFASALQTLESDGDREPLVGLFADDAGLERPEVSKATSSTVDADAYWQAYLDQFDEVRTEFGTVHEDGSGAWLEWSSRGTLSTGRPIEYAGVSLLELDDEGRVTRFATYYDTAAFLEKDATTAG